MGKETSEVEQPVEDKTYWDIQWEYHRMKTSDITGVPVSALNNLGREGWELMAVFPIHAELNYIFKKPRPVE